MPGFAGHLINRRSCSTILFKYLHERNVQVSELVNKSPREARVSLGVSGKARESQYLGV